MSGITAGNRAYDNNTDATIHTGSASANYFNCVYNDYGGSFLDCLHAVDRNTTSDGTGIPGGVGGGAAYQAHAMFYVGVADVEAALQRAERLGGTRVMGPERAPTGLVVGHFTDPEGNLIGVAGAA